MILLYVKGKKKKRKDHALCQIKYWARNEKREIDLSPVICTFSELGSEGKEMIGPRTSFFFFFVWAVKCSTTGIAAHGKREGLNYALIKSTK